MALNIKKAIKRPGDLTRKAKAAGLTLVQYATKHAKDKGTTGYQARFYLNTLRPINKKKKK
jgi:hypothetical protein